MSTVLLLLSLALASEPPTEALEALGLDTPTTSEREPGWRAALPDGGLVRAFEGATVDEADAFYDGLKKTAQTAPWPDADAPALGVDRAVGDGRATLLIRKGVVVLYVRDLGERSSEWVTKILPLVDTTANTDTKQPNR